METLQKPHMVIHVNDHHNHHHHHQSDDEGQRSRREKRRRSRRRNSSSSESVGCSSSINNDEIVNVKRKSCVSEVDLECDVDEEEEESGNNDDDNNNKKKLHLGKEVERDCRICHLSLDLGNQESGVPIELGCSCKDDLAAAHKHCAEAWFKIKGNKTCEICGSVARNVAGPNETEQVVEQWNDTNEAAVAIAAASVHSAETRHFWQGHRFLNFLLACMVFAFVISWLFHFNVRA